MCKNTWRAERLVLYAIWREPVRLTIMGQNDSAGASCCATETSLRWALICYWILRQLPLNSMPIGPSFKRSCILFDCRTCYLRVGLKMLIQDFFAQLECRRNRQACEDDVRCVFSDAPQTGCKVWKCPNYLHSQRQFKVELLALSAGMYCSIY